MCCIIRLRIYWGIYVWANIYACTRTYIKIFQTNIHTQNGKLVDKQYLCKWNNLRLVLVVLRGCTLMSWRLTSKGQTFFPAFTDSSKDQRPSLISEDSADVWGLFFPSLDFIKHFSLLGHASFLLHCVCLFTAVFPWVVALNISLTNGYVNLIYKWCFLDICQYFYQFVCKRWGVREKDGFFDCTGCIQKNIETEDVFTKK